MFRAKNWRKWLEKDEMGLTLTDRLRSIQDVDSMKLQTIQQAAEVIDRLEADNAGLRTGMGSLYIVARALVKASEMDDGEVQLR